MNYTNLDDALAALRQLTSTGDALKADLVELVNIGPKGSETFGFLN